MREAKYAPMYCALYPEFAEIARSHGYAMAVHGSLQRDMDLICIPWVEIPADPEVVVDAITTRFHIRQVGVNPELKLHGRLAYTVSIGFGECAIDLSFMPAHPDQAGGEDARDGFVRVPLDALAKAATALSFADCYDEAADLLSYATAATGDAPLSSGAEGA